MLGTSQVLPPTLDLGRGTLGMEKAIIPWALPWQHNVGSPDEPPGSFHLVSFVSGLLCK